MGTEVVDGPRAWDFLDAFFASRRAFHAVYQRYEATGAALRARGGGPPRRPAPPAGEPRPPLPPAAPPPPARRPGGPAAGAGARPLPRGGGGRAARHRPAATSSTRPRSSWRSTSPSCASSTCRTRAGTRRCSRRCRATTRRGCAASGGSSPTASAAWRSSSRDGRATGSSCAPPTCSASAWRAGCTRRVASTGLYARMYPGGGAAEGYLEAGRSFHASGFLPLARAALEASIAVVRPAARRGGERRRGPGAPFAAQARRLLASLPTTRAPEPRSPRRSG